MKGISGTVSISRSPVVHPGDGKNTHKSFAGCCVDVEFFPVQRVYAIGKPPEDKLCLFSHLKNCVVLPSVGKSDNVMSPLALTLTHPSGLRSLASMLGGGDLDG